MNKKLSVIVPVYNAEKYLERCINSILSQEGADFELLLIDDGSSDSSLKICHSYEEKDNRVKVFQKKNGGPSSARNFGLEHSSGEYITFVDSDDWIKNGFFQRILEIGENADFLIFGINFHYKTHTKETYPAQSMTTFTVKEFLSSPELYRYQSSLTGPVARIFKRSIINRNHLSFDISMNFGEDSLFNVCYLNCCKTVLMDDDWFYNADKENLASITHNYIKNHTECRLKYIEIADKVFNGVMSENNYNRFVNEQLYNLLGTISYTFKSNESIARKFKVLSLVSKSNFLNSHTSKDMLPKQKMILFLLRKKLLSITYLIFTINTILYK